jgi:hypothetical protein
MTLAAIEPRERKRPGPKPRNLELSQQSVAIQARWDAVRATEQATREYFREIPIDEAHQALAAIRKTSEIAAQEINQRLGTQGQFCKICKKPLPPNKPPALIAPIRDPATGTLSNEFYCSAYCVRERNRIKLGLAEDIK